MRHCVPLTFLFAFTMGSTTSADVVQLEVDPARPVGVSQLSLGITHTHVGLDHYAAKTEAVAEAKRLLVPIIRKQNIHIMGWGAANPQPEPGRFEFDSLDARMAMARELGTPVVITLCTAPGWMKRSGEDWAMDTDRPKAEHFEDFAALAVAVAKRYPEVEYFQVWNELKGFWNPETMAWDAEEYTRFYNIVYDALKEYNPNLKVGGPYIVLQGTGSQAFGYEGRSTAAPITAGDRAFLEYWIANKRGADFFCVDMAIVDYHDTNEYTIDQLMSLTSKFESVTRQLREMTSLPIWFSEYYALGESADPAPMAAACASIYAGLTRGGASFALLWNPLAGETFHPLLSDVRESTEVQKYPHYEVFRIFHEYFGPGTTLVQAESSTAEVEVLASETHTLLINKASTAMSVRLNEREIKLAKYQVRLVENE